MMNENEKAVALAAEDMGWEVQHKGAPDFLLVRRQAGRISEVAFLEVKSLRMKLTKEQRAWKAALVAMRLPYYVLKTNNGDTVNLDHVEGRKRTSESLDRKFTQTKRGDRKTMAYTADRESRLTQILERVGEQTKGGTGLSKRTIIGWASEAFEVSPKTVEGYIETLDVRGLIKNVYGFLHITPKGKKKLKEQSSLPKPSKGGGVAET